MAGRHQLNATGAATLAEITHELQARRIRVSVKAVQAEHPDLLAGTGIVDALSHQNHLTDSLQDAVAHAHSHVASSGRAQSKSVGLG